MDEELKGLLELISSCIGEGDQGAKNSLSVIVRNNPDKLLKDLTDTTTKGSEETKKYQKQNIRLQEQNSNDSSLMRKLFSDAIKDQKHILKRLSEGFGDLLRGIPFVGGIVGGIYDVFLKYVDFQKKNLEEYRKMFYTNVPWFTQDLYSLHEYASDIGINHEQLMSIYQANSLYISKLEAFTGKGIETFNEKLKSIIHAGDVYGVDEQNATLILNDIISSTYDNLSNNINNINERSEIYLKNLKALSYWSGKSVDTLIKENKIKEDDLAGKLWEAQGGVKQKILMDVLSGMNASSAMKADFAMAMDRGSIANVAPVNSELYRILMSLMNLRQHENMYSDSEYQYEVNRILSSIDKAALARATEMNPAVGGHLSQDMQYAGVMAMNLSQHAGNYNDIINNVEKRDENGNVYKVTKIFRNLESFNESLAKTFSLSMNTMEKAIIGIEKITNGIKGTAKTIEEIVSSDNPMSKMFGIMKDYWSNFIKGIKDAIWETIPKIFGKKFDHQSRLEKAVLISYDTISKELREGKRKYEDLTPEQKFIFDETNKKATLFRSYTIASANDAAEKFYKQKFIRGSDLEELGSKDIAKIIIEGKSFQNDVNQNNPLLNVMTENSKNSLNLSDVTKENTKSVKEQIEQQKKNSELDSSRTNLANAMTNSSNAMKENTEAVKAQTEQQKQNQENKKELSEKMGLSFNDMLEGKHLNKFSEDYKKTIENSTDNTNLTALKKSYEISELKNHLFSEHLTEIGKLLEKSKAEKLNEKEFNLLFDMDSKNFGQMMDEEAREEYLENRKNAFNEYIKDPDYVMKQLFSEYMSLASSNSENNISKTSPMNSNNEQMPEMKNQYEEKQKLEQAEKAEQARKEQEENQKQENAEIKQKIQSQYQQSGNLLDVLKSINDKLDKLNALANIDRATKNIYENGVGSKFKTEE